MTWKHPRDLSDDDTVAGAAAKSRPQVAMTWLQTGLTFGMKEIPLAARASPLSRHDLHPLPVPVHRRGPLVLLPVGSLARLLIVIVHLRAIRTHHLQQRRSGTRAASGLCVFLNGLWYHIDRRK